MSSSVHLDAFSMKQIIGKAILDSISNERKDAIIADAVQHLLAPRQRQSGFNTEEVPSILQQIFNEQLVDLARQETRAYLEANPELRQRLVGMVADAFTKLMAEDRYDGLVDQMAGLLRKALTGERY